MKQACQEFMAKGLACEQGVLWLQFPSISFKAKLATFFIYECQTEPY